MFGFIGDICREVQFKSIQRKLDAYELLVNAGVDEKSDKMIDLQIEIAEDAAHLKGIYGR